MMKNKIPISSSQSKLTPLEIERRACLKLSKPRVHEKVLRFENKLKRGESIAIIQLQYDYACNFHCQHCSVSAFRKMKPHRVLTIDAVRDLANQADKLGLAHIDITGGEPLLFPDLEALVSAIEPYRFYLQMDTNGWLMTDEKARQLKSLGIDKIQLSLDSLSANEHDAFRRKPGAHARAINAIDSIQKAGLSMHIATVVTHQRLRSTEFMDFLNFCKHNKVPVSVCWPKPVGEWSGHFDGLITTEDIAYLDSLRRDYHVYEHLTQGYGLDIGCLAAKRMISVLRSGDVLPCPWMYFSLGNIFDTPLRDLLEKGMSYFGRRVHTCLVSSNRDFINRYITKTYGTPTLLPIDEVLPQTWEVNYD